jgi:hypothetical protein
MPGDRTGDSIGGIKISTAPAKTTARQYRGLKVKHLWLITKIAALALCANSALAKRTDVIELDNGDHITGEVLELASGQLKFKTDHAGTLYIDWTHVASLTTDQPLRIELIDGQHLSGSARKRAPMAGAIHLEDTVRGEPDNAIDVQIADIVELGRMKRGPDWYDRLEGDVSLGYSYTRGAVCRLLTFPET